MRQGEHFPRFTRGVMSKNKEMNLRIANRFSGLWLLAVLLTCSPSNHPVQAEPEPIPPGLSYSDSFADDAESYLLLQRLKQIAERKNEAFEQARELADEQIELQAMLEAEARRNQIRDLSAEDPEMLPIPSAIVHHGPPHSGKRTSYMTLCHFKICNMGRKRQL